MRKDKTELVRSIISHCDELEVRELKELLGFLGWRLVAEQEEGAPVSHTVVSEGGDAVTLIKDAMKEQ